MEKDALEAIRRGLRAIINDSAGEAMLWHFEQRKGIPRKDIPDNLEAFRDFLREVFGEGSKILEKSIARELDKIGIEHPFYSS